MKVMPASAAAGELGVLGEEAVAGVDRVGAGLLRHADDLGRRRGTRGPDDPARRSGTPRRPSAGAASCGPRTGRRRRSSPEFDGGTERPDGDLTAVGDQDLRNMQAFPGTGSAQRTFRYRLASNGNVFARARSLGQFLKGGVGKTTVTLGLASAAFARGVARSSSTSIRSPTSRPGMDIQVAGHLNVADVLASPKEKIVRSAIAPSGWALEPAVDHRRDDRSPSAINFDGPHPSSATSGSSRRRSPTSRPTTSSSSSTARPRSTPSRAPRGRRATGSRSSPSPACSRSRPPTARCARSRRSAAGSPPPAAARHRRQPRARAVARAPVPHQGAARHVRPARALARSCPSARRCSRRRAPRSRCTCGPARAPRRMSNHFDQLLERVLRTARIGEYAAGPGLPRARLAQPLSARGARRRHPVTPDVMSPRRRSWTAQEILRVDRSRRAASSST